MMKALVWTNPREMRWMDVSLPDRPNDGWIESQSIAAGICGSEVSAFLGLNELRTPPLVMGHEFTVRVKSDIPERGIKSGELVTVNPLISCGHCRVCQAGQRQLCRDRRIIGIDYGGAFGEDLWVPARQCYKVTNAINGTLVEPLACALRATNLANIQVADTVLVIGAGIMGLMAGWMARSRGASRVIVVDTNEVRLQQASHWRATDSVNALEEDVSRWVAQRFRDGVDAVIDAVGFEQTRLTSVNVVRRGGRVVWLGLHENATRVPANQWVRNETMVLGSFCYTDDEFGRAVDLVNADKLPQAGAWLDVRTIEEGDAAFCEQAEGPAPFAKIVLRHQAAE